MKKIQFWVKVGPPMPASDADWRLFDSVSRSPAKLEFDSADVGKQIWVKARWVSTRGAPGPFCNMESTVIS